MTYNDLQREVLALGFESSPPEDELMLTAANRAIRTIFTEREARGCAFIYQSRVLPSFTAPDFTHTGSREECFELTGKCCSFLISGVGSYTLTDGRGEKTVDFSGNLTSHKELIFGGGKITFSGSYTYTVLDFAVFSELFGGEIEDIPTLSEERVYELRKFIPDYFSLISAPTDGEGIPISGAKIEGGRMTIPFSYVGKIRVEYKLSPRSLGGSGDENISLPDGCEHLLALLTASYVWLDDDAEKAEYYAALYREGMASLRYYSRTGANLSYTNLNGWA